MASGDYVINNLYQPGYSSFKPGENAPEHFMYKERMVGAREMGITINPMVANQVGELSKALNQGVIPVEVGALDMKTFETVPKYHWDEMRRKAELSDSRLSMHAPVIDPTGFGEQGTWNEQNQEIAERQLSMVAKQASSLSDTESVPVTIHAANGYAGSLIEMKDGEKGYQQLTAVDRSTGQLAPLKGDIQYLPGLDKEGNVRNLKMSPEEALMASNTTQWRKEIDDVIHKKDSADKIINKSYDAAGHIYAHVTERPDDFNRLPEIQKEVVMQLQSANAHMIDTGLAVKSAFDKAYQYATNDSEANDYFQNGEWVKKTLTKDQKKEELKQVAAAYERNLYGGYTENELSSLSRERQQVAMANAHNLKVQSKATQQMAEKLRSFNPQMIQRVEDFAKEKASETLANVAYNAYDYAQQQRKIAPTIAIENLGQGFGFSQADDLRELVDRTRENFQKKLVKDGLSKKEADKKAGDLIGVTFDVGHLNLSKKYGFKDEDLVKEAAKLKDYVKHIHLTDNFGHNDVHLPVGMGNVPVEKLLKTIGDKEGRIRKINEVGGYVNAFGAPGFKEVLEAAGSPIYGSGSGPYWSQNTGFQQSYSGGMGESLPMINYETFGAGFSNLPQALGGVRGQGAGRMGGGGF
ncbi:MAG: TIM barrel protein [Nanoarchaeota archaeon]|jgi:sugar phosphate isomerase/epimerase|nr:TIM barrel protein [Nanoarchaeota archaeon]